MNKLEEANSPTPHPEESPGFIMYFVFGLILGATSLLGFYVQPAIYHNAAAVWHFQGMLTDVCTCALPLFNWALAFAALVNFVLFVFAWLNPEALGRRTFCLASLLTVIILCGYIMNLLTASYMTSEAMSQALR